MTAVVRSARSAAPVAVAEIESASRPSVSSQHRARAERREPEPETHRHTGVNTVGLDQVARPPVLVPHRVQPVAQLPAGMENQVLLFANLDRSAGPRVAGATRPPGLWREGAEIPQFDAITARQPSRYRTSLGIRLCPTRFRKSK